MFCLLIYWNVWNELFLSSLFVALALLLLYVDANWLRQTNRSCFNNLCLKCVEWTSAALRLRLQTAETAWTSLSSGCSRREFCRVKKWEWVLAWGGRWPWRVFSGCWRRSCVTSTAWLAAWRRTPTNPPPSSGESCWINPTTFWTRSVSARDDADPAAQQAHSHLCLLLPRWTPCCPRIPSSRWWEGWWEMSCRRSGGKPWSCWTTSCSTGRSGRSNRWRHTATRLRWNKQKIIFNHIAHGAFQNKSVLPVRLYRLVQMSFFCLF